MRRTLISSSLALGLTAVVPTGCKVKVGTSSSPDAETTPASKPAQPQDMAKKPTSDAPSQPAPQIASTWGHGVMVEPERTLERVGKQLVPPGLSMVVGPSQLKSMLAMQLGNRGDVARHIDLSRALGCVVVNPKVYENPVVCAVGYEGGMSALVKDMGSEGYMSGGDDYAAYELSGEMVFFKEWGDHIGVAFDPTLLASSESAVRDAVLSADENRRDVHFEAKPDVIANDARQEIDAFMSELEEQMSRSSASPFGDEYARASAKASLEMYRSLADLASAELTFRVGADRTTATYRGTANAETPTAAQYARDQALSPVQFVQFESLPANAWFVGAAVFDFEHMLDDPWFGSYLRAMQGVETPDGANLGDKMAELTMTMSKVLEGRASFAVYPVPRSVGAFAADYVVKPGEDAMAVIRDVVGSYKIEEWFPQAAGSVVSTYKRRAFSVGGVRAETWTLAPTKAALEKLRSEGDFAKLEKSLGKVQLTIAYAQRGEHLYMVATTANAKRALEAMLRAANGKENMGKNAAVRRQLEDNEKATALMMWDVKAALEWVRSFEFDDSLESIPELGVGMDDVVWASKMGARGKKKYVFSVSQALIDQLRSL